MKLVHADVSAKMLSFMTETSHSNNLQTMTTGLVGKELAFLTDPARKL